MILTYQTTAPICSGYSKTSSYNVLYNIQSKAQLYRQIYQQTIKMKFLPQTKNNLAYLISDSPENSIIYYC